VRALTIVSLSLALASCAGAVRVTAERIGEPTAVQYSVADTPNEQRIYVTFVNDSKAAICFGPENWPERGFLLNNGENVHLEVDEKKYYLESVQDYCPRCNIKVEPRTQISSYFKYESFYLPVDLMTAKKTLSFRPLGYKCR
jgi:hypothetical protein